MKESIAVKGEPVPNPMLGLGLKIKPIKKHKG